MIGIAVGIVNGLVVGIEWVSSQKLIVLNLFLVRIIIYYGITMEEVDALK